MKRVLAVLACLPVGVVVAVGVLGGSGGAAASATPVKVGVVTALSGPFALSGTQIDQGMKVAAAQLNASGGVLGHKVSLMFADDQAQGALAVTATRRLLSEGVNALTGSVSSDDAGAIVSVAKNTVPTAVTLGTGTSISAANNKNIVQMNCSSPMKEQPLVNYVGHLSGLKSVALMLQNNEFGTSDLALYKKAWAKHGPKIAYVALFQDTETNFSAYVAHAKAAGAQGLYVAGATPQYDTIFAEAQQIGYSPKLRWLAGEAVSPDSLKLNSKVLQDVVTANVYNPYSTDSVNKSYVAAFKKMFHETPGYFSVLGYDSVMDIAAAMRKAGSITDAGKIDPALRTSTFASPDGPVKFGGDDNQATCLSRVTKVVNGKLTYVK